MDIIAEFDDPSSSSMDYAYNKGYDQKGDPENVMIDDDNLDTGRNLGLPPVFFSPDLCGLCFTDDIEIKFDLPKPTPMGHQRFRFRPSPYNYGYNKPKGLIPSFYEWFVILKQIDEMVNRADCPEDIFTVIGKTLDWVVCQSVNVETAVVFAQSATYATQTHQRDLLDIMLMYCGSSSPEVLVQLDSISKTLCWPGGPMILPESVKILRNVDPIMRYGNERVHLFSCLDLTYFIGSWEAWDADGHSVYQGFPRVFMENIKPFINKKIDDNDMKFKTIY